MQISGGFSFDGGIKFVPPAVAGTQYVSGDPALPLGVTEEWTSNTYMNMGLGLQTIQGSDYTNDTNNMLWLVFYAHQQVRLPVGSNRFGAMSRISGSNTFDYYGAISSAENTKSNFSSNVDILIGDNNSSNYTANVIFQTPVTTAFIVPAKRYFLIGITGGPYYKNYRKTANNYTVVSGGNAIITALNEYYYPGWPSGPTRGIPTLLGGNTAGYTKVTGNLHVASYKFEIV